MLILQKRLSEMFIQYANRTAIEYGDRKCSYHQLDVASDCIMHYILSKGIPQQSHIGILLNDKMDLIALLLGILKARCIFVPLDPKYPDQRLEAMIHISDTQIIFSDTENQERLKNMSLGRDGKITFFNAQELFNINVPAKTKKAPMQYRQEDAIYIYFTSGTTGSPKAIVGKNESLLHFIQWEIETFHIDPTFRISQFTSSSFDPFLRDIFVPLCSGAMICIPIAKEILLETETLIKWIEKNEISLIHCTPSLFKVFNSKKLLREQFKSLKYILLAGEKLNPQELVCWYRIFGDRIKLVNLYGPSETTLAKLFYLVKPEDVQRKNIPIGNPIYGAAVLLLNADMKPCTDGEPGEIFISTPYRSLGYYKNPDLNKEKFIPNPISSEKSDLIYKTGDLGRFLPDGNVEFLGRADRQVKIRGMRVELGEIENEILKHSGVDDCVVHLIYPDDLWKKKLIAYIVSDHPNIQNKIYYHLEHCLPDYMIPSAFVRLDKIPMTPNGKIDYNGLPNPQTGLVSDSGELRSEVEKNLGKIWSEVLEIDNVGREDDFFRVGGNSLSVIILAMRIEHEFGIDIPMNILYKACTIQELAKFIKALDKKNYEKELCMKKNNLSSNIDYYQDEQTLHRGEDTSQKILQNIEPFNDIFFKSCYYNSFFPVMHHFNRSISPLIFNDLIIYNKNADIDSFGVDFIPLKLEDCLIRSLGIGISNQMRSADVIGDIIVALSKNRPVIVWVDSFYESVRTDTYQKMHCQHTLLVFGYDEANKQLHIVEHNHRDNLTFKKRVLSYEDMVNSYYGYIETFQKQAVHPTFFEFFAIEEDGSFHNHIVQQSILEFKKNIYEQKELFYEGLKSLKDFTAHFKRIVLDQLALSQKKEELMTGMNDIINGKKIEQYRMLTILSEKHEISILLDSIINQWTYIRFTVGKFVYSNIYTKKLMENSLMALEEIEKLESQFVTDIIKFATAL